MASDPLVPVGHPLPKGLKLSSTGVLSGTLNKKLAAGPSSATVQVTETVTTLNGKKKVKDQDDGPGHHSPDHHLSRPIS
jgi:Putative Ig domain